MTKNHQDFLDYLKASKSAVIGNASFKGRIIHVIVGNEACDLDSAVSALVYAFHLTSVTESSTSQPGHLIIPVLNIPKDDYGLKTEVVYALQREAGVREDDLIFADHLDVVELTRCGALRLTLVDHHLPVGKFAGLERDVGEIIDHHSVAAGKDTDFIKNVKQTTIEPVGSCATLIAEKVLAAPTTKGTAINSVAVTLLRQAIILDTVNFSPSAKKTTPKDVAVTAQLEMADCCRTPGQSRDEILADLTRAKSDISALTTAQLLQKDLKVLRIDGVQLGVSSIPVLVKEYFGSQQKQQELADRCRAQSVDAAVVLGVALQGDIARDLLLYSSNTICLEKITEGLKSATTPSLQLAASDAVCPVSNHYRYFQQANSAASRKQILPVLADTLHASSRAIHQAVTRKASSDIPETATPPNSFMAGHGFPAGIGANADVFSSVNRRILDAQRRDHRNSNQCSSINDDAQNLARHMSQEWNTATPSNTYVDDTGRNFMNMRGGETEELRDRMEWLMRRQDESDGASGCGSPCNGPVDESFSASSVAGGSVGREMMFDMEEIDEAVVTKHGRQK